MSASAGSGVFAGGGFVCGTCRRTASVGAGVRSIRRQAHDRAANMWGSMATACRRQLAGLEGRHLELRNLHVWHLEVRHLERWSFDVGKLDVRELNIWKLDVGGLDIRQLHLSPSKH